MFGCSTKRISMLVEWSITDTVAPLSMGEVPTTSQKLRPTRTNTGNYIINCGGWLVSKIIDSGCISSERRLTCWDNNEWSLMFQPYFRGVGLHFCPMNFKFQYNATYRKIARIKNRNHRMNTGIFCAEPDCAWRNLRELCLP